MSRLQERWLLPVIAGLLAVVVWVSTRPGERVHATGELAFAARAAATEESVDAPILARTGDEPVKRAAYEESGDPLMAQLRPLDALLIDMERGEPVPFAELVVVDMLGVSVEASSDADGRVRSNGLLKKGLVAVHVLGGPSRPVWRHRAGLGARVATTSSPNERCAFDVEHGASSEWADVWRVRSARLLPLAIAGIPELRPELSLIATSGWRNAVVEVDSFSDSALPFWRGATHVAVLGYSSESRATQQSFARAVLMTRTDKFVWAAPIEADALPRPGETPLRATLAPLATRDSEVLGKQFGNRLVPDIWREMHAVERGGDMTGAAESGVAEHIEMTHRLKTNQRLEGIHQIELTSKK